MAYTELNDYSRVIAREDLKDLLEEAADGYSGKSSDIVQQNAEKMAEARIRLYLGLRFDMDTEFALDPNSTAPPRDETILSCYLMLAVYFLHFVINARDMPEDRQKQFDDCLKNLERIRDGELYTTLTPVVDTTGSILIEGNCKFISKPFTDAQVLDSDESTP